MTRDTGLFGPGTVTWKVNREAVLLAGGGRALLLQVAHPSVAAGVVQHSDYDTDPYGRLFRTLDLVTKITFGSRGTADRAATALRRAHDEVRGERPDGERYFAHDPNLLLWVWATLVETSVLIYTRYVGPLPVDEVERYYSEQQRFGEACGIPSDKFPEDWRAFVRYYHRALDEDCLVTPDSRRIGESVVDPAVPGLLKPAAKPAALLLNLATIGLLPPQVRERYGFSWGPRRERVLGASTVMVRRLLPALPSLVREMPPARTAERRVRAAA
jgi:uncharacterized protein (DUF2236 family)